MTIDSYDPEYKEYSIYKTIRRAAGNIPFIVNTANLGTEERFQRVVGSYCEDGSDESIGLDYQDNVEGQLMMAKMKLKFIGYKKGTWKQKVDKAYLDCIG